MRFFHVTIHAHDNHEVVCQEVEVDGHSVSVLQFDSTTPAAPFNVTFDDTASRLIELDRMYFEPDGSFVWVSEKGPSEWQLDGLLTDRGDKLMTIELKGSAPWTILATFLGVVGWPQREVVFQDMHRGLFYATDSFRQLFGE